MPRASSTETAREILARNLHRVRTEKQMSQSRLATLSQTRQALISEIEMADANPTIDTLARLAAALGVTVTELMTP